MGHARPHDDHVRPRGDRILSLSVNETDTVGYSAALNTAMQAGITAVSLPQNWDDLETGPGVYHPEPNFLAVADRFYTGTGLTVSLGINPIDTTRVHLPEDLRGKAWDDPQVIERYKRLLDYALGQVKSLELTCLTIGNEIDGVLRTPAEWKAYTRFFREVADYARGYWPGIRVGTKGMLRGMTGRYREEFQRLNRYADVVMVTYYPLNDDFTVAPPRQVHADFDALIKLYPDRPVYVMEIGYPSGEGLGSSRLAQADFISEAFAMWDRYADVIGYMEFTWMHEQPEYQLDVWAEYYGIDDSNFREFLGTLGLRENDGRNKAAFERFLREADRRGW